MAIVKMKKLRVISMASQRQELLKGLLSLGCVEVSEPSLTDPAWEELFRHGTSHLTETRSAITDVNTALAAIKRYAQLKDGMFVERHPISEADFLGVGMAEQARQACREIGDALQKIAGLESENARLTARIASLQPWKSLDMPLEQEGTAHTVFRMGVLPALTEVGAVKTALAEDAAAELYDVSADKLQTYCLTIFHRADTEAVEALLKPYGFSAVTFQGLSGTAAENIDALTRRLAENQTALEETTAVITAHGKTRDALRVYADRLSTELLRDASEERLLTDGTILFFEGWAPADSMAQLADYLDRADCAWEAADPTEEEYPQVPVKLKNTFFTRCMNVVTEMYSLPAYNGIDPNPLMAPFFILFFGIMMADMAYGVIMIAAALFVLRKRPLAGTRNFMELVFWCGVSTTVVGALTGGFLGDFIPQIARIINPASTLELPALFTPLDDTVAIMLGSLVLGAIQVFTGMLVSVIRKIKSGQFIDALFNEITWWIILAGVALMIFDIGVISGIPVVLVLGGLMLVFGGTREAKGLFGKGSKLVGLVYNGVTGFFSDILSYVRLMALMLSGSVIAQVFNTLGATFGNVFLFILISLIGNALNLALNLLGCYVHDLRLQCLEFFGRFYEEGGKPYRPLSFQTKYVDIIKEEQ